MPYEFRHKCCGINRNGLPHSGIPASKLVGSSTGLIAANHALHLRLPPRPPPYTLINLTILLNLLLKMPLPVFNFQRTKPLKPRIRRIKQIIFTYLKSVEIR